MRLLCDTNIVHQQNSRSIRTQRPREHCFSVCIQIYMCSGWRCAYIWLILPTKRKMQTWNTRLRKESTSNASKTTPHHSTATHSRSTAEEINMLRTNWKLYETCCARVCVCMHESVGYRYRRAWLVCLFFYTPHTSRCIGVFCSVTIALEHNISSSSRYTWNLATLLCTIDRMCAHTTHHQNAFNKYRIGLCYAMRIVGTLPPQTNTDLFSVAGSWQLDRFIQNRVSVALQVRNTKTHNLKAIESVSERKGQCDRVNRSNS